MNAFKYSTIMTRTSLGLIIFILASLTQAASLIPAPPAIQATSYLLMDANSGKVLISHNADQAIPPASLTKIMTSYVTEYELEQGNISLQDQVPVSVKAWRKGGSKMYIKEGSKVALEDLLKGIIIQSGNDASIAVAEYIAGSEEAFAELMNKHAQRLGLTSSHFVNATGWPAENHYSSAQDLALMSRALIRDFPQHYSLYAEKEFTYNGITQPNRNTLLNWNDKVDGIKTGHTNEAGYCLVASAQDNGMRLISVVTGTQSDRARATESQKMLTYGFRFFETQTSHPRDSVIANTKIWKGNKSELNLVVAEAVILTYPRGQFDAITPTIHIQDNIEAPITKGTKLGSIDFTLNNENLASYTLVAQETIEKGGLFSRLFDTIWLFVSSFF